MDRYHTHWTLFPLENAASPLAGELRELLEKRLRRIREDDEKR